MAITKLMNENEEHIKNAISDGISGDAIESTLEDAINKSDSINKTPKQVQEMVETIVDMKTDVEPKIDESYASNFVKENSEQIKSALNDGITPKEVANTLVNSSNEATNKKGRRHLKFIVNLISKLKKKELKLNKEKENTNEKGYQKILKDK